MKQKIKVLITGACGKIGSALIPLISSGQTFGDDQPVDIHLLDIELVSRRLEGIALEIQDCAYPLVNEVVATTSLEKAFKDIDWAIMTSGTLFKVGMVRRDMLAENVKIYKSYGNALDKLASRDVKVVVVANPANTMALTLIKNAPSIPKENITALCRLDTNRMDGILAKKLGVSVKRIKNSVVFGNHSRSQVPFPQSTVVDDKEKVLDKIADNNYIENDFVNRIQYRADEVVDYMGTTSVTSPANAAKDHCRDWYHGTQPGKIVCMGVISDNNPYNFAKDIIFSLPVQIKNKKWKIVDGFKFTDNQKSLLKISERELLEEKNEAMI